MLGFRNPAAKTALVSALQESGRLERVPEWAFQDGLKIHKVLAFSTEHVHALIQAYQQAGRAIPKYLFKNRIGYTERDSKLGSSTAKF
jgi:hypothetical protein